MDNDSLQAEEEAVRSAWGTAFQVDPAPGAERYYLTVAYPYPSGAMHVGHGRTYLVPDVVARFWRMRGRRVLYPMAFHVTGAPVIGISKRIANRDPAAIRLYRDLYRVPPDVLERFVDPVEIVRHFSDEYERVMRMAGLSIDWRRRFTTVDPHYSRFIEWQVGRLREKGFVVRGAHPVRYCPLCDNPVGDHDLLEGDRAEVIRFVLVMFRWGETLVPTATLRPETVYGVTNLWVNPEVTYVRAEVDGKAWLVSREAAEKLSLQDHEVRVLEEVPGSSLVDQVVSHPLSGDVPVLPASFVDPDMATGIVMSVPAHAPFDYIALRDLQQEGRYTGIVPKPLITVEGWGECPAKEAVERAKVANQHDARMDALTQEVYGAEFAKGRLHARLGGLPVREARDAIGDLLIAEHGSAVMYEFDTRPVVCRCSSRVYVKILHDQWFLTYSDPAWKELVKEYLSGVSLVPPEVRAEFERTIDWLKDWAATRRVGLGTRLPWDPTWLVEPLSDSTIYMAYYTIAHRIRELDPALLTPAAFDYLFLGIEGEELEGREALAPLREEFLYWYPYDYRFSAKDLISNHLTFQLFHHAAIFPPGLQPRGMVVFGMGLLNGAKMSSSKGNVFLLEDALAEFGADTVRMFLMGSAEPWQDFDWRNELVASTRRQIERFETTVLDSLRGGGPPSPIDDWLLSRLQRHVARTTRALESFQTRQALQEAFFGIEADLRWYVRRQPAGSAGGAGALQELCSAWVRLLAPFIPFTCERLWEALGQDGLVSFAPWPLADPERGRPELELGEELLSRTLEDVESILKLLPITPKAVEIALAPDWKWDVFRTIAASEDRTTAVRAVMQDEGMRRRGKEAADAARQVTTLIHRLPPALVDGLLRLDLDEPAVFAGAREFLEQELGLPVRVVGAEESDNLKAGMALPFKPAITVE
ncbi:MAG: leucine--tRNA ligase [Methanospirillum sp.]|nr:leucine--tRNA ligase [Methanospirillum sp.]